MVLTRQFSFWFYIFVRHILFDRMINFSFFESVSCKNLDTRHVDSRIPPDMFAQFSIHRTRRSKLTFLERLDYFDLTGAIQDCIENVN